MWGIKTKRESLVVTTLVISLGLKLLPVFVEGLRVAEDPLIFQHNGWLVTEGIRPYVDFYEIKPPGVAEANAVISLIAGGNVLTQHLLSIALMNVLVIGSVYLIYKITYTMTGDVRGAAIAALSMFALPSLAGFGWSGFFAKSFALFFGLLGMYLTLKNRQFAAGIAAAASPAFWQFGLIFPLLAIGINLNRTKRRYLTTLLLGMASTTVIILGPVVWWGGSSQMIGSVILVPMLSSGVSPGDSILKAGYHLRWGIFVVALGGLGIASRVWNNRNDWWLAAGGLWFFSQLLFVDYEGARDLYLGMAFVSVGVGLVYSDIKRLRITKPHRVAMLVVFVILANIVTTASLAGLTFIGGESVEQSMYIAGQDSSESDTIHGLYWTKQKVDTCYYTAPFSSDLRNWVSQVDEPITRGECPTAWRVWQLSR